MNSAHRSDDTQAPDDQLAANVIRDKLARLYDEEPSAQQELTEADSVNHRSKHQQFMHQLGQSGKDLATIQTEWHEYYQNLPADEKHQVWQEFYASQSALTQPAAATATPIAEHPQTLAKHKQQAAKPKRLRDARSKKEIQASVRHSVSAGGKLKAKHHLQSLAFGLGMGLLAVIVFLFGFFNEFVIAPFIQPARANADTPLIVSTDSVAPSATPEVIIPKINVEIPVIYDQPSIDEDAIQADLENGVVHYPTTVKPGQVGNAAIFGHSSNNIFNKGKYKFAFVLLHTLVEGDTFYLTYDKKVYVYKVIAKKVVEPHQVEVLDAVEGQTATATLITCDPPGTSLRRLVVIGQQITPDPNGNAEVATPAVTTTSATNLPGNGQTLWGRFIQSATGKVVVASLVVIAGVAVLRQLYKRMAATR